MRHSCDHYRSLYKCLSAFAYSLLFFCQPCPGLWNCKSLFLILKFSQYSGLRQWVQLFLKYPCKNWYENWCHHFNRLMTTKFDEQVHLKNLIQITLIRQVLVTPSSQIKWQAKNISTKRTPAHGVPFTEKNYFVNGTIVQIWKSANIFVFIWK